MNIIFDEIGLKIKRDEKEKGVKKLSFDGALKIENVNKVRDVLKGEIQGCCSCDLFFEENSEIDLSGIQLLHAMNISASQNDIETTITGELPLSVKEALKFTGYDKFDWMKI